MTASSLRSHCGFIWLIFHVKTARKLRCFHLTAKTFLQHKTGCLGPHYKTSLKKKKTACDLLSNVSPTPVPSDVWHGCEPAMFGPHASLFQDKRLMRLSVMEDLVYKRLRWRNNQPRCLRDCHKQDCKTVVMEMLSWQCVSSEPKHWWQILPNFNMGLWPRKEFINHSLLCLPQASCWQHYVTWSSEKCDS